MKKQFKIFALSLLVVFVSPYAHTSCEGLFSNTDKFQRLYQKLSSTYESSAETFDTRFSFEEKFRITVREKETGMIIMTQNHHLVEQVFLESFLKRENVEFEKMEFHGKTFFHVK